MFAASMSALDRITMTLTIVLVATPMLAIAGSVMIH